MKILAYIRVSTDEQAKNGESLETQTRKLEGYAMMNGWTITETFIEAGVSGSIPLAERPQGARMLAAVGKGDVVMVTKLDRMFRSAVDALVTAEEFKNSKVSLHMLDLGGDVVNNGMSKAFFTMAAAFAELERDTIRERIRDVKRRLAADGVYAGGSKPYGYDVDGNGKLVPNDAEQAVIAKIMELHGQGQSPRKIGDALGMAHMTVRRLIARKGS